MKALSDILKDIQGRIEKACARAGRDPSAVEIVAVTKTHGPDVVREALDAGLSVIGENKVQEASWKKAESPAGGFWHLIGHLQTNKVRPALELFDVIESVDSVKLASRIQAVSDSFGFSPRVLLEVNVAGESSKSGVSVEGLKPLLEHCLAECPRLQVEGLMTMAPFSTNPEDARPFFRKLRELRDECETSFGVSLPRLSMGMSGDFEVAVEEGATWVRLGTCLFGERPKIARREVAGEAEGFASGGLDSFSGEGPTVKVLDL